MPARRDESRNIICQVEVPVQRQSGDDVSPIASYGAMASMSAEMKHKLLIAEQISCNLYI
jgi:hypothetical protein